MNKRPSINDLKVDAPKSDGWCAIILGDRYLGKLRLGTSCITDHIAHSTRNMSWLLSGDLIDGSPEPVETAHESLQEAIVFAFRRESARQGFPLSMAMEKSVRNFLRNSLSEGSARMQYRTDWYTVKMKELFDLHKEVEAETPEGVNGDAPPVKN